MLQCESPTGFMLVPPPPRINDRPLVLAVIFRPLVHRVSEAASASPAHLLAAE